MIDAMVELLGWALIDAAWQGVIVGALYVGARALVRDARLRLAIGHFALLALALLPIASLVVRLNLPAALPGAATAASLSADSIGAVATAPSVTWASSDARLIDDALGAERTCSSVRPDIALRKASCGLT